MFGKWITTRRYYKRQQEILNTHLPPTGGRFITHKSALIRCVVCNKKKKPELHCMITDWFIKYTRLRLNEMKYSTEQETYCILLFIGILKLQMNIWRLHSIQIVLQQELSIVWRSINTLLCILYQIKSILTVLITVLFVYLHEIYIHKLM